MKTVNLKDKITTYAAYASVVVGIVNAYLQAHAGQAIDWKQLGLFLVTGLIAYFTGKNPDGTAKTPEQVANLNNPKPTPNDVVPGDPGHTK
jgi:hypothetical protein